MVLAVLAEGGLVVVALALGAWAGVAPFSAIDWSWRGLAWGIAATAPLLLGLAWCLRTRLPPVARLVREVEERVGPLFAGSTPAELALVAALAGLGEELLFRGVLQPALDAHLPTWAALILAAAIFGLLHCLTLTYALLATLAGGYFGWLFLATGNLLVPIVAHAAYDLVALRIIESVRGER